MSPSICSCPSAGATHLDLLDELVNDRGWAQPDACAYVAEHAARVEIREAARAIVHDGLADVLTWLRAAGVAV